MSATAREILEQFICNLREAGVTIGVARTGVFHEALQVLPAHGLHAVFLAGRTTLCATLEDLSRYDACFAKFFFGDKFLAVEIRPDPAAPPKLPGGTEMRRRDAPDKTDDREIEVGAASDVEVLRNRRLSTLSKEEIAVIHDLTIRLRGKAAPMPGRRQRLALRGAVDIRRTVKAAFWRGGEPDRLYRRRARPRIRKRVLLLDISGSMSPFAPGLLRFGYAAYRCAPARTEVFTIGTRLTRVTRHFATGDAQAAIFAASHAVPDWSGGTRLGDQLKRFLDMWGQRGMARGAIIVIASDGLERGGAALLGAQMHRLQRLSHRVIWANPHKSTPGFEPLTAGMMAALPAVDDFVSGSSAAELAELIHIMGER